MIPLNTRNVKGMSQNFCKIIAIFVFAQIFTKKF